MNNLKHENQDYSNDIIYHLERLQADLYRMQIGNNRDFIFSKSIDSIIEKVELMKRLVEYEIRFDWKKIQGEMFRLFKEDNSLTGFDIRIEFKESENPNLAFINVKILGKDESKK